ncbi:hypothetical protein RZS28_18845 (plasmid) [Methylocapsa polymorpha]|uniref:Uncharacterized protein n=1 Tax=Methylocapsa polymorpha TaxID=3080828 RepID=A0ABZ0HYH8_9HYPH|nr:hypothetical protein [Methylocapsa sp. RX1]WOJ91788.1 hypothetical protein RZS28_18845 [Methylocapsa sp. RX1]
MNMSATPGVIDDVIDRLEGGAAADLGLDAAPIRPKWSREGDDEIKARALRSQSQESMRKDLALPLSELERRRPNKQPPAAGIMSAVLKVGRRLGLRYLNRSGATKPRV